MKTKAPFSKEQQTYFALLTAIALGVNRIPHLAILTDNSRAYVRKLLDRLTTQGYIAFQYGAFERSDGRSGKIRIYSIEENLIRTIQEVGYLTGDEMLEELQEVEKSFKKPLT